MMKSQWGKHVHTYFICRVRSMNLLLKGALLCSQAMCPWLFMLFIMHLYLHVLQLHTHIELQFIYILFSHRKIIIIALDLYMSCLTAVFWYLPWGNKPCIVVPHKLRFRLVGPMYMRRSLPLEPVERRFADSASKGVTKMIWKQL